MNDQIMQPFTLDVYITPDMHTEPVQAWPTGVPGLAVHRGLYDHAGRWVVSHVRSTTALTVCDDPESAIAVARDVLGKCGLDFTQSAESIRAEVNRRGGLGIHLEHPGTLEVQHMPEVYTR